MKPHAIVVAALAFVATACDGGSRPQRLLYGEHASEFSPVAGSVMTQVRVLNRSLLGRRLVGCRAELPANARIVERIGVFGESLTMRSREAVLACDGGLDTAHERAPPWCGSVVGRLVDGHLLDPRLDILCEDRDGDRLAYAFVVPVAGAHWIGVDQGAYTEIYEVVAGFPVRVVTARRIDRSRSSAVFAITQYDTHGRELVRGDLETRVAG